MSWFWDSFFSHSSQNYCLFCNRANELLHPNLRPTMGKFVRIGSYADVCLTIFIPLYSLMNPKEKQYFYPNVHIYSESFGEHMIFESPKTPCQRVYTYDRLVAKLGSWQWRERELFHFFPPCSFPYLYSTAMKIWCLPLGKIYSYQAELHAMSYHIILYVLPLWCKSKLCMWRTDWGNGRNVHHCLIIANSLLP